MSELSPTTGDWCAHCGVGFILPSGLCDHCNANPCAKVLDHKWLDPVCVEGGCQSLFLKHANDKLAKVRERCESQQGGGYGVECTKNNAKRELATEILAILEESSCRW